MNQQLIPKVTDYVEQNIASFHNSRIEKLKNLKLKTILKKKNPYLFRTKHIVSAPDLVKSITDAFLSSAEETMFGDWLERLAIYICSEVYGGRKSSTKGIDMEFDHNSVRYIVAIKSGPNWGNSSQIAKMKGDFITAKRTMHTSGSIQFIQPINGCCYGIDNNPNKGDYIKYCGQNFWHFISGEQSLYIDIIEPLSTNAKARNEEFANDYCKILNLFTKQFIDDFCDTTGQINWIKLLTYNSGSHEG